MDNEKRQALSVYRMEQAEETLTAAKMCLEYHLYKDCINRSYYVAFYAVKAVLALSLIHIYLLFPVWQPGSGMQMPVRYCWVAWT